MIRKQQRGNPTQIANLLDEWWEHLGLTGELFSSLDYTGKTCPWSDAFFRAGFTGLRVGLRHPMNPKRFGLAIYGYQGPQPDDRYFEVVSGRRFSRRDMRRFSRVTKFRVYDPLTGADLDVWR